MLDDEQVENNEEMSSELVELSHKRLELEKIQDQHQFEIANKLIEAQSVDNINARNHEFANRKLTYLFMFGALFVLGILIMFAISKNEAEFAIKLIEILGAFLAGASAGYGYAFIKQRNHEE